MIFLRTTLEEVNSFAAIDPHQAAGAAVEGAEAVVEGAEAVVAGGEVVVEGGEVVVEEEEAEVVAVVVAAGVRKGVTDLGKRPETLAVLHAANLHKVGGSKSSHAA